jgi:carbamoyltransferase
MDEMENLGKIPVLLNTSFNIKGKPILTTIKDAITVLEETEIDHIIIEDYIFSRAKK